MSDAAVRLGNLIYDSLFMHTGRAPTLGSYRIAEDVLADGYVKLDGIDAEELQAALDTFNDPGRVEWRETAALLSLQSLARAVLAALDEEETP